MPGVSRQSPALGIADEPGLRPVPTALPLGSWPASWPGPASPAAGPAPPATCRRPSSAGRAVPSRWRWPSRSSPPTQVPAVSLSIVADVAPTGSKSAVRGYAQYSASEVNWARATADRMFVVALRYCHRSPAGTSLGRSAAQRGHVRLRVEHLRHVAPDLVALGVGQAVAHVEQVGDRDDGTLVRAPVGDPGRLACPPGTRRPPAVSRAQALLGGELVEQHPGQGLGHRPPVQGGAVLEARCRLGRRAAGRRGPRPRRGRWRQPGPRPPRRRRRPPPLSAAASTRRRATAGSPGARRPPATGGACRLPACRPTAVASGGSVEDAAPVRSRGRPCAGTARGSAP